MEAGGKYRPPMLAPGNYVQWKSRIKRYIDTKPNHELINYCLKNPPYKFTWADKEVLISEGSSVTTAETYMETYKNVSQDIRDQLNAEAEAVQIILTGIDNDIYSTVDACPNACEMWKATERVIFLIMLHGGYFESLEGWFSSVIHDFYSITLQDTSSPNPIFLMPKAKSFQAWLWHRRLSHLNFNTSNLLSKNGTVIGLPKLKFVKDHLFSSCELGKAKRKSFQTKTTPSSKRRLQLLHMDLCGPMRVESINRRKYVLVIIDDYSRYTWTHILRSKDETPEVLIDFLRLVQRGLYAQVRIVRTDKGTEFFNKTLHAYFASEGINHQMSVARTPEQNGVVERRNRMLGFLIR
nr:retrovirus-related Pol polyprotein from transposon TNT 1-94 [Tanacetum cinerariifolium]